MAIKFQYNKTFIQALGKQLAIRQKALPILKNKEMALRKEVKERKKRFEELSHDFDKLVQKLTANEALWAEFPKILFIKTKQFKKIKVVGVNVPELDHIDFELAEISWWHYPAWLPLGIQLMKEALSMKLQIEVVAQQLEQLDAARKKTTQKVNLYEKVQIPEMEEAILKIKRFLEDKENISKAGQKIMKKRQLERELA